MKNVPLLFIVSYAVLSIQPSLETLMSNMLSNGASSVPTYHIAPWKNIVSPAATHELSAKSSEITAPV